MIFYIVVDFSMNSIYFLNNVEDTFKSTSSETGAHNFKAIPIFGMGEHNAIIAIYSPK